MSETAWNLRRIEHTYKQIKVGWWKGQFHDRYIIFGVCRRCQSTHQSQEFETIEGAENYASSMPHICKDCRRERSNFVR